MTVRTEWLDASAAQVAVGEHTDAYGITEHALTIAADDVVAITGNRAQMTQLLTNALRMVRNEWPDDGTARILPSTVTVTDDLLQAAVDVVARWESGDLADAVWRLDNALAVQEKQQAERERLLRHLIEKYDPQDAEDITLGVADRWVMVEISTITDEHHLTPGASLPSLFASVESDEGAGTDWLPVCVVDLINGVEIPVDAEVRYTVGLGQPQPIEEATS